MNKKQPKILLPTESEEQISLLKWAKLKSIPLIHIPNESPRTLYYGAILVKMGLSRGFPDLFLPKGFGGFFGMFIEMKRKKKYAQCLKDRSVWRNQEEWLNYLKSENYYAEFAFGWEHAAQLIENYIKAKPTKEIYGQTISL